MLPEFHRHSILFLTRNNFKLMEVKLPTDIHKATTFDSDETKIKLTTNEIKLIKIPITMQSQFKIHSIRTFSAILNYYRI